MNGQVLIIDDNYSDVKVASHVLERCGFSWAGFTDPVDGLKYLDHYQPQLVLLDLQLENLSGFEFISKIKRKLRNPNTPIIIVSGKNQVDDVKKGDRPGGLRLHH